MMINSVKSRSVTTPPDPNDVDPAARPAYGDAYLSLGGTWPAAGVPVNSIGIWSALGGGSWQAAAPGFGPPLYVQDEDSYIHWAGNSGWADGIGNNALLAQSVPRSALIWDGRVQNQTTTAPPASWSKGVAYIVGPSATGDWAGHDGKVAIAETDGVLTSGDEFTIYAPYTGMTVYDVALGYDVRWSGTAWKKISGNFRTVKQVFTTTGNWTKPDGCFGIRCYLLAGGGGGASATDGAGSGGATQFSTVRATGGGGGLTATAGAGGAGDGSGSDYIISGGVGQSDGTGGAASGPFNKYNWVRFRLGDGGVGTSGYGGSAGGYCEGWKDASDLADIETVTVGTGAVSQGGGANGGDGVAVIEAYILT